MVSWFFNYKKRSSASVVDYNEEIHKLTGKSLDEIKEMSSRELYNLFELVHKHGFESGLDAAYVEAMG